MGQFRKATVDISYDVVTHSVFTIRDLPRQFKNRMLTSTACGVPQEASLQAAGGLRLSCGADHGG